MKGYSFSFLYRYLAICHPFWVQRNSDRQFGHNRSRRQTTRRSLRNIEPSRKRLYRYTFIVFMTSIVSTIPVFFEFKTETDFDTKKTKVSVTALRIDENYIIFFKNGFEGIFLVILPLVIMVCLNAQIIYKLLNRRRIRSFGSERQAKNEMNLAKVLVAMDLVFLVCNLGRVAVNVWEFFHMGQLKECLRINLPFKHVPDW